MRFILIQLLVYMTYQVSFCQIQPFIDLDTSTIVLENGRIVKNRYSTNIKLKRIDDGIDTLITNRYNTIFDLSTNNIQEQQNLIVYYHNEDLLLIESLVTGKKRFLFLTLDGDAGYDDLSSKVFYTSDGLYLTLYYDGIVNGKKKLTEIDYRSMEFGNSEDILYHYYNEN